MRNGWLIGAVLAGSVAGGALVKKLWLAKYREQTAALTSAERERDLLYTWLLLKEKDVELKEYFSAHRLKTVAILGMNHVGRRLYEELQGQDELRIVYGVEAERFGAVHETLTVYRLGDDPLPPADCVVICDLEQTAEKAEAVRREFSGKVVTLAELLSELLARHDIGPRNGAIAGWPPIEEDKKFETKQ